MKSELLKLLLEGERLSTEQMAGILDTEPAEIETALKALKEDGTLLGWRPILNPEAMEADQVRAIIEVRVRPEREGGFGRLALRVSRFEEVESCYLVSGSYDLLLISNGNNLHQVAHFVSEKLATMEGVLSTATHFMLRAYKEQGYQIIEGEGDPDKPTVSP
jgi:DNA-binding Lrp family transcriptional regulator